MQKRCYGCMRIKNNSPVCEHCGFDERVKNEVHQLPMGTVLRQQYLVGRVLGQGGFGITYMGWDLNLDAPIAIKEYFPRGYVGRENIWSNAVTSYNQGQNTLFQEHKKRFLREARILAKLEDVPQIVRVKNFFEDNNTAYIIMEYIAGMDLRHYIQTRGGRLSPEETFAVLGPIVSALSAVHREGLVHRDISPDNIMLLPNGRVKLLDFGAVRYVERADAEGALATSTQVILKQGFAPYEQYLTKGSLGPWTDIYALCATIYYCLTGRVPAEAPERMMEDPVNWNAVPGLAAHQAAALAEGMALLAKDRPDSVEALWRAIQAPSEALQHPIRREREPVKQPPEEFYTAPLETGMTPGPQEKPSEENRKKRSAWIWVLAAAVCVALAFGMGKREILPGQPEQTEPIGQEVAQSGVLMTDPLTDWSVANIGEQSVLGSAITRKEIFSVTFLDTVAGVPQEAWDVSQGQDGSVWAWTIRNNSMYNLYIAAEGGVKAPRDCIGLFANYCNVQSIQFNGCFDTSDMVWMNSMFEHCTKLSNLDLRGIDTSQVRDMSYLFRQCNSLETLELSGFDTSRVTNMAFMFNLCTGLKQLDVSGFDTAAVTEMGSMFNGCESLQQLDLRNFNTSQVTDMSYLFYNCGNMRTLDLSSFDTSAVTDMSYMFYYCENLANVNLRSFDTSRVTAYACFMDEGRTVNGKNWESLFQ